MAATKLVPHQLRKLLTAEDVIELLRIDDGCGPDLARERLRNRCRAGQLPYVQLPGSRLIRFRPEDIEKLIEASTVPVVDR